MKYCHKCGASLEDDLAFCIMCGVKVEPLGKPMNPAPLRSIQPNQPTPAPQRSLQPNQPLPIPPVTQPPKKKKRKTLLIILLCLCVLLVGGAVAGILFLRWYQDPQQQLSRALKDRDWQQVIELAQQEPDLCDDPQVVEVLEDQAAELTEQFNNGDMEYDDYVQKLTKLKAMNPESLGEMIDQAESDALVQKEYSDWFDQAQSYMTAGDYASAMEAYRKIVDGPLYEQAQAGCTEAEDALRQQILDEAEALADEGKYAQAEDCLIQGLNLLPQDADLLRQQETYQQAEENRLREDALLQAEQYVKQEKYPAAFKILRDYQQKKGEDSKISAALSEYEDEYVETMIEKADTYAREYRFEEAFKVLDEAMKELPNDSRLSTTRKEIEKLQPVSLDKLKPTDSYRWNPNEARLEDCLGNEFYDSVNAFVQDQDGYALFQINGGYTRITGQLSSLWIQKRESFFLIYADNELLYYSKGITPSTKPFTFDVDIPEGAKQLKLMVVSEEYHNSSILLSDVYLWP